MPDRVRPPRRRPRKRPAARDRTTTRVPAVPVDLEALVSKAKAARARAYAPYSKFLVGAALLGESGRVYLGCNVENSSYGLCLCAERGAVARAVADGELRFRGIVVSSGSRPPAPPCGMCRQVLAEFAPEMPILLVNDDGAQVRTSVAELLPLTFTKDFL